MKEIDNTVLNAKITYIEQQIDLNNLEIFNANNEPIQFGTVDEAICFLKSQTINTINVCNKVIVKREQKTIYLYLRLLV